LEARGAVGEVDKLPEIARGMKANQVGVIVAADFPVILACKVANSPSTLSTG
jgi:hypothetical protein